MCIAFLSTSSFLFDPVARTPTSPFPIIVEIPPAKVVVRFIASTTPTSEPVVASNLPVVLPLTPFVTLPCSLSSLPSTCESSVALESEGTLVPQDEQHHCWRYLLSYGIHLSSARAMSPGNEHHE